LNADLDTVCIAVHRRADDLVPRATADPRRELTDAEAIAFATIQVILGAPSSRRRQIESVSQIVTDLLIRERRGARSLEKLRARCRVASVA
jgi:hypothetical protein